MSNFTVYLRDGRTALVQEAWYAKVSKPTEDLYYLTFLDEEQVTIAEFDIREVVGYLKSGELQTGSVYRNERCDRKDHCYDYQGWHCASCNGAKENNKKKKNSSSRNFESFNNSTSYSHIDPDYGHD